MTLPTDRSGDYRTVHNLLAGLRRRIRSFVLLEAVLMSLVLLGVLFWGGLTLDWMFEPSPRVRVVVHVAVFVTLAGILVWWGLRRWMVALSDRSLALLVERQHPELNDALSVAVDLGATGAEQVHPELARRTMQLAAEQAARIDTDELLNGVRLNRIAMVVGALAMSVVALAMLAPTVWSTYADRLALSPDEWPRQVDLAVEGFQPDGEGGYVRKVARNSDVPVVVNAKLTDGLESPERVTIRYRWQEGRRGRDDLIRIGDAVPGRDNHQRYEYLFERIASDVEFEIRGGDDRVERLRLEVVERPKVTDLAFACRYPDYLERAARTIPVGPRVELPEGTRIEAQGEANKPLEVIRWRRIEQTDDGPVQGESVTAEFATSIDLEENDVELEIELTDADGITSAEPFRVTIAARRDQKPQVIANRDGIGTAVTTSARVPLEVSIEDDHAVRSVWLELHRDDQVLPPMPVDLAAGLRRDVVALATVDLAELAADHPGEPAYAFAPGQKLSIVAAADDKYDLQEGGRTTEARALAFEVVSEDELMARLATAEQNLRQTFESVADKLLLLYGSLEKLDATGSDSAATARSDQDLLVVDTSASTPPNDDGDRLLRESHRLAETARQIGSEISGVASGFDEIHSQLRNNRIDNSELLERIGKRIAGPLHKLGDERMAAVATRIADIGSEDSNASAAKAETRLAIVDVEKLLQEMQGLENYNEVIATLRDIIRQQQQINAQTKKEQKSELQDLLLD